LVSRFDLTLVFGILSSTCIQVLSEEVFELACLPRYKARSDFQRMMLRLNHMASILSELSFSPIYGLLVQLLR
jgi:hypothetical protein